MNSFPMIRVKWSNEHIMAGVFLILVLYHLPLWNKDQGEILIFILLVGIGLLIDCVAGLIRYKRLWCCVSGAVTAATVSLLTGGVPVWGRILGVAVALILGKHIWGGTGKNLLNPAMIGIMAVMVFFKVPYPPFEYSLLLLPAALLGLAFLWIRPFAGTAFILGMLAALIFTHDLSMESVLSYGILFWGCLVMTDPVTITPHPAAGSAAGFLAGFAALYYFPMPVALVAGVLAVNLFSDTINGILNKEPQLKAKRKLPEVYIRDSRQLQSIDLTGEKAETAEFIDTDKFKKDEILNRIKLNALFGMGGAAFPTCQKLMTVLEAECTEKHLIINGAECDPGLIHDKWILQNHMEELVQGIKLLRACIPFTSIQLAVKNVKGLKVSEYIKLKQISDRYPAGAEKILIYKVLGKKLDYHQIPAAEGILVLNVQTVYAVSRAVIENKQIDTRYITVADIPGKTARVVKVRIGMKLREILERVYPGAANIYAGGGIMQSHLAEEDETVGPMTNFISTGAFPSFKESPQCSKCSSCSSNCPSGLMVNVIADLVDQDKLEETRKYRAAECISCGSCSYNCLAGRNLAAKVKRAKEAVNK